MPGLGETLATVEQQGREPACQDKQRAGPNVGSTFRCEETGGGRPRPLRGGDTWERPVTAPSAGCRHLLDCTAGVCVGGVHAAAALS